MTAQALQHPAAPTEPYVRKKNLSRWVLHSNRYLRAGLLPGDILWVSPEADMREGRLLVLHFDGRFLLRRLECRPQAYWLHALDGSTQPIEWPRHEPLPLLGRVVSVERPMP